MSSPSTEQKIIQLNNNNSWWQKLSISWNYMPILGNAVKNKEVADCVNHSLLSLLILLCYRALLHGILFSK